MALKNWKELPWGGIIDEGSTALQYHTGSWRTFKPIHDAAKCIHCHLCWVYCPDGAIKVANGKIVDIDLNYCKGCGICASVCPVKCIKMVKE